MPDRAPQTFGISPVIGVSFSIIHEWLRVGTLDSLKMELVTRKTHLIRELELSALLTHLWEREVRGGVAGCRLSTVKTLELDSMSFQGDECMYLLGAGASQFHGDRSSCAQDPSGLCPMYLSIWLFICIYNILFNKLVNITKRFSLFWEPL